MGPIKFRNKERHRAIRYEADYQYRLHATYEQLEAERQPFDDSPSPVLFAYDVFIEGEWFTRYNYWDRKQVKSLMKTNAILNRNCLVVRPMYLNGQGYWFGSIKPDGIPRPVLST